MLREKESERISTQSCGISLAERTGRGGEGRGGEGRGRRATP